MNMVRKSEIAASIRDHALMLVRTKGERRQVRGMNPVLAWAAPPWSIVHRTPFQPFPDTDPALSRQMGKASLGYGLDIWHGGKVFSVEWAEEGAIRINTFKHGAWEAAFLAL